jgi:transposase
MIDQETEAKVLRLYHVEKWKVGTIAKQAQVHPTTVHRILMESGLCAERVIKRPSKVDPYLPFIKSTLEEYPKLCASRLYQMVKERGYDGAPDHFRAIIARYRPRRKAEAYLRLRTLPGDQGQVDWGSFGTVRIGKALRKLYAFVMVLSYSRQIFLRFYYNAAMPSFLQGHQDAFEFFQGVPRVLLYDNLKSAVLERVGTAIRFNPKIIELSAHYRFEPRPVNVARGNEKGRVERAIRYIRDNFFEARKFGSLEDLNQQALEWMIGPSADRLCPEDRSSTVRAVFLTEKSKLLTLPDDTFPCEERVEVHSGKTPYIRFDLNDYSIPFRYVCRTLTVIASQTYPFTREA